MGFPQSSHAWADIRRPQPWGCCDRCGFRYMRNRINWQFDWRGNQMQNLRILVDHRCMDEPNPQLRPIIVGPDPYPVRDPRPGFAAYQQGQQPPVQTPLEIITDDEGIGNSVFPPLPPNFGLFNPGTGPLGVSSPNYWPTNTVGMDHPGLASYGLAPGDLFSLGGFANVIPGNTPDPLAPLVFFGQINSFEFLLLGGKNLPFADPAIPNALWNNNGVVYISVVSGQGLTNNGGFLVLNDATVGFQEGSAGLPPGTFYSNGLFVSITPGGSFPPGLPPYVWPQVSTNSLLFLGAGPVIDSPAVPGSGQLFLNGGFVCVA